MRKLLLFFLFPIALHAQTVIGVSHGGTGANALTQYYMLLGNGTSPVTLVAPGTATYVWTSNGAGAAPTWQAPGGGGGGWSISGSPATDGVLYATSSTAAASTAAGGNAQFLTNYPNGLPNWGTTFGGAIAAGTSAIWLELDDTVTATSGNSFNSGAIDLQGQGYSIHGTHGSKPADIRIDNRVTVNGAGYTVPALYFSSSSESGSFLDMLSLSQTSGLANAPTLNLANGGSYQINGTTVLSGTNLGSGVTVSSLTSLGVLSTLEILHLGLSTSTGFNAGFFQLYNTSSATSGAKQQYSPAARIIGTAWNGTSSENDEWYFQNRPQSVASGSTSANLVFSCSINNGGHEVTDMTITSGGIVTSEAAPSGTNTAGLNFTIAGGPGTGNAASGATIFENAVAVATGTTVQTLAEEARIDTNGISVASGKVYRVNTTEVIGGTKVDLNSSGHIVTSSSIGSSTQDGTGVTSSSVTGSDAAGTITLTSALNAGGGTCTVTFGATYSTAPVVIFKAANSAANALALADGGYATATATTFTLNWDATVAETGAKFNYIVLH